MNTFTPGESIARWLEQHIIDREGHWCADALAGEIDAMLETETKPLIDALDYLLEQTVDQDLKYGITLSEGEHDAREKALAIIAKIRGETQCPTCGDHHEADAVPVTCETGDGV